MKKEWKTGCSRICASPELMKERYGCDQGKTGPKGCFGSPCHPRYTGKNMDNWLDDE